MKPISLPFRYTTTLPAEQMDVTAAWEMIRRLRDRGTKVLAAALAIEDVIVQILARTIFEEMDKHRNFAVGLIFTSDWCSFSAKRRLLLAAIERFTLLEGKAKTGLDESLSRVMRYRNAFAHGSIEFDGKSYVLRYFESTPKVATLNDEYWEKLERAFSEPWDQLLAIETKLEEAHG
jgi:hypothetical protein